jgi:hypothetical protein
MTSPVAVNFDTRGTWSAARQVTQRIEYVVNQVARTHRGQPENDVMRELQSRLRGLGVPTGARQLTGFAHTIANLPPMPPPPPEATSGPG